MRSLDTATSHDVTAPILGTKDRDVFRDEALELEGCCGSEEYGQGCMDSIIETLV